MHQVRNDNTDQIGMVSSQRPRELVWTIIHFAGSGEDTRPCFLADLRVIVDSARNRHLGDVQRASDIFQLSRHLFFKSEGGSRLPSDQAVGAYLPLLPCFRLDAIAAS